MSKNESNRMFTVNKKSPLNKKVEKRNFLLNKSRKQIIAASFVVASLAFTFFTAINFNIFETIVVAQGISEPPAQIVQTEQNATVRNISYERPSSIGGPTATLKLSSGFVSAEERSLESRLREIVTGLKPESLPLIWSHMGKINNEFGYRRNPFGGGYEFHGGIDIDGNRGDIIVAPGNGIITKAGWQGGYGNLIEIDHGNGLTTRYGHLSRIDTKIGDTVQRGQVIGLLGSTGRSTGPHLHYEIRVDDKTINPRKFLPPEMPR